MVANRVRFKAGICLLIFSGLLRSEIGAAQQTALNLMPVPASVQTGAGSLRVDGAFSVGLSGYSEARLDRGVARFLQLLSRQTGFPLAANKKSSAGAALVIFTDHASKTVQELGEDESYVLEVTAQGAKLSAPTPLGTLHGLQTFLQLVEVSPDGFAAPSVTIQDKPRFAWRGTMIDAARHFMPLEVIRRNLDGMEAVKMNVFHWHLSENQGFRVESKKFPKLHGMGSDGLYYTQDEIRGVIAYARDRGIRVVPEFDLPGHSTAWFVGYPELASAPGPYEIERRWGVFNPAIDPTNEKVYKFLDQFIGEMVQLFPDQFFHVGGDEVNGKQWDANPKIQEFIKAHGLKDNEGLQAYFNKKLQAIVQKHGRSMIGWDEVLDPSLPKEITIQSWRGQESLAEAAKQGYRGILSNGYYLDLGWSAARHYAVDPLSDAAANLTAEQKQLVLGGESCMWAEYVSAENVDSRIWPRNAAIAERFWSPQEVRDTASMYARMNVISARLEWLGLTHNSYYRQMLQRIAGPATPDEVAALRTLADVVEPVKNYERGESSGVEATSDKPLHRVVDAISLESDAARRFAERVDSYVGASCRDDVGAAEIRKKLTVWAGNDARLTSLMNRSFLASGVKGASKGLSEAANIGLTALDSIVKGTPFPVPEQTKAQEPAALDALQKEARAEQLLVMPVPAVKKLLEAASAGSTCRPAKQ